MDGPFDIAIVGAGMAGASLAASIGDRARVLLLEAEDRPGYHSTGRSAAFWSESYGGPSVQPLTTASGPLLAGLGLLRPRGALMIGRACEVDRVEEFAATYGNLGVETHLLDRAAIEDRVPGVRPEWTCAVLEPSTSDIDVAGLHQHYLAAARRGGTVLKCRAGLAAAERRGPAWHLTLADGSTATADILVNAAGAWADPVAAIAGARPLGVAPYRRTIAQVAVGADVSDDMPLVIDISETFYFKAENGRLWLSPHDETPSLPCDAAPEEMDVAIAIDRLEGAVEWPVRKVEHRWAGLRSFAPDRLPIYGFAPETPGFFWFAGQGGFGIQTAPAAAELGARLLLGDGSGAIDPAVYAPGRFTVGAA